MPAHLTSTDAVLILTALAVVAILASVVVCHVAHKHDASAGEFCMCLFCLAVAAIWRRSHGRHRMEDKYHLQRWIRADWHRLTPRS